MTLPTLIWTAVCLWATVSSETPPGDLLSVLYPPIGDTVTLTCESPHDLLSVHWFRVQRGEETNATFQYLLQITQSARTIISADVEDGERFKVALRGLRASTLRVVDVTERDAGIYSCVFEVRHGSAKRAELWRPGVLLRPGVTPPPPPPGTNPPSLVGPKCRCPKSSKNNRNGQVWFGCSTMVLWPLAGVLLGLGVALIATVFYFSRLPRKCRHRFAKKL